MNPEDLIIYASYFVTNALKGRRAYHKVSFAKRKDKCIILGSEEFSPVPDNSKLTKLKLEEPVKCAIAFKFLKDGSGIEFLFSEEFMPEYPIELLYETSCIHFAASTSINLSQLPVVIKSDKFKIIITDYMFDSSSNLKDVLEETIAKSTGKLDATEIRSEKEQKPKKKKEKKEKSSPGKTRSSADELAPPEKKSAKSTKKPKSKKKRDLGEAEEKDFEMEEDFSMPELPSQTQTQAVSNLVGENTQIITTGFDSGEYELVSEYIQSRGYFLDELDESDTIDENTILIAKTVSKTLKFLLCVCKGATIVGISWAKALYDITVAPPFEKHLLTGEECTVGVNQVLERNGIETFDLRATVDRARESPVFKDYAIIITTSVGSEKMQQLFTTLAMAAGAQVYVGSSGDETFLLLASGGKLPDSSRGKYAIICTSSIFKDGMEVVDSVRKQMFSKDFLTDSCLLQQVVSGYDNVEEQEDKDEQEEGGDDQEDDDDKEDTKSSTSE
ncbi:hypothetical protein ADUPG1_006626 [Aduncisulcus paluster]|uniref:SIS domain-containing protein n=1 Tax=Aduncisulcus paluster TaxID=2918883 RepID=A0ABQ5KIY9_9EUKA|nr:hypothetical protein ADUPG1_006626 [Aduncisulcus paluster]